MDLRLIDVESGGVLCAGSSSGKDLVKIPDEATEKLSKKGTNCTIVNARNIPMNPFHRGMTDEMKILSKQIEQADNIIIGMGIHNYSINYYVN